MRILNLNVKEDLEYVEFVLQDELGLNISDNVFKSKSSLLNFYKEFSNLLNKLGLFVEEGLFVVYD